MGLPLIMASCVSGLYCVQVLFCLQHVASKGGRIWSELLHFPCFRFNSFSCCFRKQIVLRRKVKFVSGVSGTVVKDSLMKRCLSSHCGQTHLVIIHLFLFPSNLALARLWHARDEDSNRKWHAPVPIGNSVCCCSRILYFSVCSVCVEEGQRERERVGQRGQYILYLKSNIPQIWF